MGHGFRAFCKNVTLQTITQKIRIWQVHKCIESNSQKGKMERGMEYGQEVKKGRFELFNSPELFNLPELF